MTPQQRQYKLINLETKEEFICDKVVIEGMDYYSTKGDINFGDYVTNRFRVWIWEDNSSLLGVRKIIATNYNLIDEVDIIFLKDCEIKKCGCNFCIDRLNNIRGYKTAKETYIFTEDDMIEFIEWINESINPFIKNKNKWIQTCGNSTSWTTKQLLDIWKEQRIETIYFK
jgi:hypothetical protein